MVPVTAAEQPAPVDPLEAATRAYQESRRTEDAAKRRVDRARQVVSTAHETTERHRVALADAIVAEARRGRGNAEIRRVTGYTRERVRQICRAAGVEPAE